MGFVVDWSTTNSTQQKNNNNTAAPQQQQPPTPTTPTTTTTTNNNNHQQQQPHHTTTTPPLTTRRSDRSFLDDGAGGGGGGGGEGEERGRRRKTKAALCSVIYSQPKMQSSITSRQRMRESVGKIGEHSMIHSGNQDRETSPKKIVGVPEESIRKSWRARIKSAQVRPKTNSTTAMMSGGRVILWSFLEIGLDAFDDVDLKAKKWDSKWKQMTYLDSLTVFPFHRLTWAVTGSCSLFTCILYTVAQLSEFGLLFFQPKVGNFEVLFGVGSVVTGYIMLQATYETYHEFCTEKLRERVTTCESEPFDQLGGSDICLLSMFGLDELSRKEEGGELWMRKVAHMQRRVFLEVFVLIGLTSFGMWFTSIIATVMSQFGRTLSDLSFLNVARLLVAMFAALSSFQKGAFATGAHFYYRLNQEMRKLDLQRMLRKIPDCPDDRILDLIGDVMRMIEYHRVPTRYENSIHLVETWFVVYHSLVLVVSGYEAVFGTDNYCVPLWLFFGLVSPFFQLLLVLWNKAKLNKMMHWEMNQVLTKRILQPPPELVIPLEGLSPAELGEVEIRMVRKRHLYEALESLVTLDKRMHRYYGMPGTYENVSTLLGRSLLFGSILLPYFSFMISEGKVDWEYLCYDPLTTANTSSTFTNATANLTR